MKKKALQTYFRATAGLVPDHRNKASHDPFGGRRSRRQFVKTATSVKHHTAELDKTEFAEVPPAVRCYLEWESGHNSLPALARARAEPLRTDV